MVGGGRREGGLACVNPPLRTAARACLLPVASAEIFAPSKYEEPTAWRVRQHVEALHARAVRTGGNTNTAPGLNVWRVIMTL